MKTQVLYILVLTISAAVFMFILLRVQKGNRKFRKKGLVQFSIVTFLLFCLVGLFGISPTYDIFNRFLWIESLFFLYGILCIWALFSIFDWPGRESFFPEFLFVLYVACIGMIGFITCFSLVSRLIAKADQPILVYARSGVAFLLPFLILKTYDYLALVPARRYRAFYIGGRKAPQINFRGNNLLVYMVVYPSFPERRHPPVIQRTRLPVNSSIRDFFLNFLQDYNADNPLSQIQHQLTDEEGNPLGWIFRTGVRQNKWGSKLIDPESSAPGYVEEGYFIHAERVLLDEEYLKELQQQPRENLDFAPKNGVSDDLGAIDIKEK